METFVSAAPDTVQQGFEEELKAALPREDTHDSVWEGLYHLSSRQPIDFDNWFIKHYSSSAVSPSPVEMPAIEFTYKSPLPRFTVGTGYCSSRVESETDEKQEREDRKPETGNDLAQLKAKVTEVKAGLDEIQKKQVSEEDIRSIVRQEVDRVRSRKPSKRRPALTQKAIRFAFDKWVRYCHNPAAVGCENGRKVTYKDVYDTFKEEFERHGIADCIDFKRAIESSRKMFKAEWKKLAKRRPYAKKRKARQQ